MFHHLYRRAPAVVMLAFLTFLAAACGDSDRFNCFATICDAGCTDLANRSTRTISDTVIAGDMKEAFKSWSDDNTNPDNTSSEKHVVVDLWCEYDPTYDGQSAEGEWLAKTWGTLVGDAPVVDFSVEGAPTDGTGPAPIPDLKKCLDGCEQRCRAKKGEQRDKCLSDCKLACFSTPPRRIAFESGPTRRVEVLSAPPERLYEARVQVAQEGRRHE